ncbi:MAG TPA: DUF92 domain-containing protein [Mucilaginibacter sp.]|jgi:uncharacterized protein (TIGR00297 family)|nr:DUF92 domain-containing protein [Mucilaginibacter sp.]
MTLIDTSVFAALLLAAIWSYYSGKLTHTGATAGFLTGLLIYKGAALTGLATLATFFTVSTAATKWQTNKKTAIGAAEKNKGRRTAAQVLANGGVAAILGLTGWQLPEKASVVQLMIAGSLAAATADTLSSELGMIYGRRFFNILTFKKDSCGLNGVISIEGTLIGLIGAMLIAAVYAVIVGWNIAFCWITLAGLIGNLVDSILGAVFERRGLMGNNLVNFLNTMAGAWVCWMAVGV